VNRRQNFSGKKGSWKLKSYVEIQVFTMARVGLEDDDDREDEGWKVLLLFTLRVAFWEVIFLDFTVGVFYFRSTLNFNFSSSTPYLTIYLSSQEIIFTIYITLKII